jgi:hypothetical protein
MVNDVESTERELDLRRELTEQERKTLLNAGLTPKTSKPDRTGAFVVSPSREWMRSTKNAAKFMTCKEGDEIVVRREVAGAPSVI